MMTSNPYYTSFSSSQTVDDSKLSIVIEASFASSPIILDELKGDEIISAPYEFIVSGHSSDLKLDLSKAIGQPMTIKFKIGDKERFFNGIVGKAIQGQILDQKPEPISKYTFFLYPKLWLCRFTRNFRIFQNMSPIDIIEKILKENKVDPLSNKIKKGGKDKREYCVQYGESDFDFVSRLMQEEGIYYSFTHESGKHSLVLHDDKSTFESIKAKELKVGKSEARQINEIDYLGSSAQIVPKGNSISDYNFETPKTKLFSKVEGTGLGGMVYDYPGLFIKSGPGDKLNKLRIQSLEWDQNLVYGTSRAYELVGGAKFKVVEHQRKDLNAEYVVYKVEHHIRQTIDDPSQSIYQNTFTAFPAKIDFRPLVEVRKPVVSGLQTALVVGKSGEEIYTDEYGRIKVQFHWDQEGKKNEESSCWVRVAQSWAGPGWGFVFIPRMGQEVIVSFINGDPDQPIVTGCVYNGDNKPPYLPDEPTKSTIKTNSSKEDDGFNELRFEDKKGEEEIYLHAQKDLRQEIQNERDITIYESKDTLLIKKGDQFITLEEGNQDVQIKKGNQTITIGEGDVTIKVEKGKHTFNVKDDTTWTHEKNLKQKITNDYDMQAGKIKIKSDGTIQVDAMGDITLKSNGNIKFEAMSNIELKATQGVKISGNTGVEIKSMTTMKLEAMVQLEMKANAMAKLSGAMVQVEGQAMGALKGGGMATVGGAMISLG